MSRAFAAIVLVLSFMTGCAATPPARATKHADVTRVLVTENFHITLTRSGEAGAVEDNHVIYHGVSKKYGEDITLIGSTWFVPDPNGGPSRLIGYRFQRGDITYEVLVDGELVIVRGETAVKAVGVEERGTWQKADGGT